ncbi:MAG TPA: dTDP-glucose 4,6-dehydratase [Candidatus Edwardsbacteria bacterium]|nr:dTDP-glucose 4,6-dehydratase [Candidatus Edwardsbacteria bacterium]
MELDNKTLMVTGGAGFIGSNFVDHMLAKYPDTRIVVYDKLNYRGNLDNLTDAQRSERYTFVKGDICDAAAVGSAIEQHHVGIIVNFAAETHVDRSIMDPDAFVKTDVYGMYVLLEATNKYQLERLHHVSTDEVYGQVMSGASKEGDPFEPRSPYAASKASGELLAFAYHTTYGTPLTVTRGANNIGPRQYPENAVPLFCTNAIDGLPIPLYGDGKQSRQYQYVMDHVEGIEAVLLRGEVGQAYNCGPDEETVNIDMATRMLELLGKPASLIKYVADRPGHDRRYCIDSAKLKALGWKPGHSFAQALALTVDWYVRNEAWWRKIKSGEYKEYYRTWYGQRLADAR